MNEVWQCREERNFRNNSTKFCLSKIFLVKPENEFTFNRSKKIYLKRLLLICIILFPAKLFAQAGMWTWIKGSNTTNPAATYGTQGVASPTNNPPGFYEPAEWTDLQGNFWFFGGLATGYTNYGDLWKYDIASNNWTWIRGTGLGGAVGSFGTMGVPSPTNMPPARSWGASTWVAQNGDLWLFGGNRNGGCNDLWRYNIATNIWTWMNGSITTSPVAVYGSLGVPSATTNPGGRWECSANWVDASGNLWLFGGYNSNELNDLWKYSIATNQWTWMNGSNTGNSPGNYGTLGVASPTNQPPARSAYCSWKDLNGKFWLFGGTKSGFGGLNDMWMYDPVVNMWTWMSGTNTVGSNGNYGAQCVNGTNFSPRARMENRCRWMDDCGRFWLYAGGTGSTFNNMFNDFWCFNPVTLEWTLISGGFAANIAPVYGTLNVPAITNSPGRRGGNVAFKSSTGELYFFSGADSWLSTRNDVWRFTPDPNCPAGTLPVINLGSDTTFCGNFSLTLSTGVASTVWSTGTTATSITVTTPGTYWATISTTSCGVSSVSDTIVVTQLPPAVPFSLGNDTTFCNTVNATLATGNASTLWSTGVTASQITVTTPGTYWASISGACGNATDSIILSLVQSPAPINLGPDSVFCNILNTILSTGNASTLWSTGVTASQIIVTTPGIYWATISNSCGTVSDTVNYTLQQSPSPINLGPDSTFCNAVNVLLTGGNASTLWSTGITASQISVSASGTYWATNANACGVESDTVVLSIFQMPPSIFIGNDTVFCNVVSSTLSTGNATTLWSTGFVGASITVTTSGTYWAAIANPCGFVSDTVNITMLTLPSSINLGNDTTFCDAFNVVLSTGIATTVWSTGVTAPQINIATSGNYFATVSNACGTVSDTILISQLTTPFFSLGTDITFCEGDSAQIIIPITATNLLWSNGETDSSIIVFQQGVYWAQAWNNSLCPAKDSVHVFVETIPQFDLGPDTTFCSYDPYIMNVPFNILNDNFHWQDNSTATFYSVTEPGVYTLTVNTDCGNFSDTKTVNIIYDECPVFFPNAFSPNGDGINDYYLPAVTCMNKDYLLQIYDRWGQKVFESNEMEPGWNGVFDETTASVGVYVYVAKYFSKCDQKVISTKGNFTLIK